MRTYDYLFGALSIIFVVAITYVVIATNQAITDRIAYLDTCIERLEINQNQIQKRIEWKYGRK